MAPKKVDLRKVLVDAVGARAAHADLIINTLRRHDFNTPEHMPVPMFLALDDYAMKQMKLTMFERCVVEAAQDHLRFLADAEASYELRGGDIVDVDACGEYQVLEKVKLSELGGVFRCKDLTRCPPRIMYLRHDGLPGLLAARKTHHTVDVLHLQAEATAAAAAALGPRAATFGLLGAGAIVAVQREGVHLSTGLKGATAAISEDLGSPLEQLREVFVADPDATRRCILDLLPQLLILQEAGVVHGDIKPDNLFWNGERYSLGDFGLAGSPGLEAVWRRHGIRIPHDCQPAVHAAVADLRYASVTALQGRPLTIVSALESLLYSLADLYGKPVPGQLYAETDNDLACVMVRQDIRVAAAAAAAAEAESADPAAATDPSEGSKWLESLPPALRQLALWTLTRTDASPDDVLELQATLQDGAQAEAPPTPPCPDPVRTKSRRLAPP